MTDAEEKEVWWRGHVMPQVSRAAFDAMTDGELDRFMAEKVCRFYTWQPDENAIWWEGADGWPTEFTIAREHDDQGRKPFRPCTDEKSGNFLRKRFGMDQSTEGRALCWSIMVKEGFTTTDEPRKFTCPSCAAVVPALGTGTDGRQFCCVHCAFNPAGCRCKYGEFGIQA